MKIVQILIKKNTTCGVLVDLKYIECPWKVEYVGHTDSTTAESMNAPS